MKETAQGGVRRPGRVPFVLMCILLVILIVLNAALITLVPQYYDTINSFLAPAADEEATAAAAQASKDMTQEIESEGIVLLENNDSTLPLASGTAVNLFGYGSRDTVYGGSGSGSGDSTNNVTLAEGLENAGLTVNQELVDFYDEHYIERTGVGYTGNNFDINEPSVDEYSDELLENAKAYSSVAVFVISRLGGEGADLPMDMDPDKVTEIVASGALTEQTVSGGDAGKHYLELQQVEIDVLNMIKENFDTVIVLVNSTNAMELGWLEEDGIDAALWIGCLGSTGANAVGEVLAGIVNPSGRTSDTFAYEVESAPSYYSLGDYDYTNIEWTNTNPIAASTDPDNYHYVDYIEGIYVGYRYYETAAADGFIDYDATVQYPFGYGLSYTSFEQEITNFTNDGTTITVDVTVTNTGSVAGKDVVQIYYTAPYTVGGIEKSEVVLADFDKTETLEPGTSETITISFLYEDMASYDYSGIKAEGGAYVLEAGEYEIKLMNNSHDLIDSRTVTVDADVIYNDENDGARSTDSIAAVNQFDDVSFGECTTYLTRADWEGTFPTERAAFSREASEETLAVINDTSIPTDESAEAIVVADHGLTLEDVAGLDYDDPLWDELLEQVSVDEMVNLVSNGGWATQAVSSVGKSAYVEVDGPNGINNIMAGTTGTQYCAQSVLACTWNTDLAYEMGVTFAQEAIAMEVAALYAPAMNIHRSPFSGRNYEYYSEDGVHSGKMAAAEVQGIQSQGVTTYCKHFAVNDQESNRDSGGVLTWVNEQAMREIYFKAFEIAVKEGGTRGIMSSFNRVGATCAAESSALLNTVLRDEWGFEGTVITDCILQLSYVNIDRAIASGNDLILSLANIQSLTEALTGTNSGQQDLRTATHNILYTAANSVGEEVSATPVAYWLYITVGVVDVALVALCVLYFVRRHGKMKKWKAENAAK
ncbi:MAG: glycoside hydrolase family 3 C-terminal domain-containing protein [Clostridiales bacterium]|nr:glycoside hydrolase family 3 C-terminal domain-containing protein [Clostridiales bacterium]